MTQQPLINSLPQFKMAKAIIWLLDYKRKNFPTNPAFHSMYRADIIDKARVNHQNLTEFIEKLIRESIVQVMPTVADKEAWWVLIVTANGEKRLRDELKVYEE